MFCLIFFCYVSIVAHRVVLLVLIVYFHAAGHDIFSRPIHSGPCGTNALVAREFMHMLMVVIGPISVVLWEVASLLVMCLMLLGMTFSPAPSNLAHHAL